MTEQSFLRSDEAIRPSASQRVIFLVVYTTFGIIHGQMVASDSTGAISALSTGSGLVEIREANVEHYSNHLPTGKYVSLFVNLQQVSGFAIIGM